MKKKYLVLSIVITSVLYFSPITSNTKLIGQQLKTENNISKNIIKKVIEWRRDFHQNPELSNREFRTSKIVAEHLKSLGYEIRTNVAHTGIVGVLKGKYPGKVVALRADMDALPVTEQVDLPFASKVKTEYNGQTVGVMHACGHDVHTSILMGAAEIFASMKDELHGTIKLIFQPAEEGAPKGEKGGAKLMIEEQALENPKPDAIFGMHVMPFELGKIFYRSGPIMAGVANYKITVTGVQTHGAFPWNGIDPIVVSSQIVLGLQTIVSRQLNLLNGPVVITVGSIKAGNRENIIPEHAEMIGTIRILNPEEKQNIFDRIKNTAEKIAEASGAKAEVEIIDRYPITDNDSELTSNMVSALKSVVGKENAVEIPPLTVAEDFSYYQQKVPGMYFFLGVTPPEQDPATVAANHSPKFFVDERAIPIGLKAMVNLVKKFLNEK